VETAVNGENGGALDRRKPQHFQTVTAWLNHLLPSRAVISQAEV
jgi:hypothetical protein